MAVTGTRPLIVLLAALCCVAVSGQGFNITTILEPFPDFGLFNEWLSLTGVANEINHRSGITILASSNTSFQSYLSGINNATAQPGLGDVADTLRYQVLLTYYGIAELQKINLNNFTEITTLLQATGRTNNSAGFVDIYHVNDTSSTTGGTKLLIGHFVPDKYGNETITGNVTALPYEYSVLQISGVLVPLPTTSPSPIRSPVLAPAPSPASPPAPAKPIADEPAGSTAPADDSNYATVTGVGLPLTFMAMFLASIAMVL